MCPGILSGTAWNSPKSDGIAIIMFPVKIATLVYSQNFGLSGWNAHCPNALELKVKCAESLTMGIESGMNSSHNLELQFRTFLVTLAWYLGNFQGCWVFMGQKKMPEVATWWAQTLPQVACSESHPKPMLRPRNLQGVWNYGWFQHSSHLCFLLFLS